MEKLSAPLIIGILGGVFLVAGLVSAARAGGISHPRTRTWLLVGAIFAVMSLYSFVQSS
jgi:hypothetical protein